MAIREATSPACAPPMPSATTNSGERAKALSSFSRRCRPVSVFHVVCATRSISGLAVGRASLPVGEFGVADSDPVAVVQWLGTVQRLLVEVGAVRGTHVLDHHHPTFTRDAGVTRGGERVIEADLDIAAAERSAPEEVISYPALVPGGVFHQQPGLELLHPPESR